LYPLSVGVTIWTGLAQTIAVSRSYISDPRFPFGIYEPVKHCLPCFSQSHQVSERFISTKVLNVLIRIDSGNGEARVPNLWRKKKTMVSLY
jgi:hypothetical protein